MVHFTKDNLNKISKASQLVADTVGMTLGVSGGYFYSNEKGKEELTNDGKSVTEKLKSSDFVENAIIKLLTTSAKQTDLIAGDGTSTTIILANGLIQQSIKAMSSGYSPVDIANGLELAKLDILKHLDTFVIKASENDLYNIAKTSSRRSDIAQVISQAVINTGDSGMIQLRANNKNVFEVDIVKGYRQESGYLCDAWINNNKDRSVTLENVKVFVTTKPINDPNWVQQFILTCIEAKIQNVVIFSTYFGSPQNDSIWEIIRNSLISVKANKDFNYIPILITNQGDFANDIAQDLAIYTNSKLYSDRAGDNLHNFKLDDLGSLDKITIKEDLTLMYNDDLSEGVRLRVSDLKELVAQDKSAFYNMYYLERIAKLTNLGFAIVKYGFVNDTDKETTYKLVEDALGSTKSANQFGIVPGGGSTLVRINNQLSLKLKPSEGLNQIGYTMGLDALLEPIMQLAKNSDYKYIYRAIENIKESENTCFDFESMAIVNATEVGVIDSYLVAKLSIENSFNVAKQIITIGAFGE